MLTLVNAERAVAGLALTAQACPDGFAEPWSPRMAAEGRLSHQALSPVISRCGGHTAAENVGMNSSPPGEHGRVVRGLTAAPLEHPQPGVHQHRGRGFRDARGVWWVTQDFPG